MLMRWHDALSASVLYFVLWLLNAFQLFVSVNCNGHDGVPGAPHVASLKREAEELFYHGFENYMKYGFPEDEVRPLSCKPLTRDRENPAHLELNDVLGNYSLTLVDTLSTLAVLASSSTGSPRDKPLLLFQNGIRDIVDQYGDGSPGPKGQGKRARGFDLDSKVQLFETAIRGLGGLLSAHLFAVGELPITGYNPPKEEVVAARSWNSTGYHGSAQGIKWRNGLVYDGQLLRLAYDLGKRLVPAFWTSTGIPYPRVNLRHGIPFFVKSPGNFAPEGQCDVEKKDTGEITETCSAGAGSLVLEFTVLSRLTGDPQFEDLAKRAFWAIWSRRSSIDLIGAGIDAETGIWEHSWTGIGAGIDSFFEYAFKTHILLSGQSRPYYNEAISTLDPRSLFEPLHQTQHDAEAFLQTWDTAHAAIQRHVYRGVNFQHPHYIQVDLSSGASRAFWVDALSAYYPGLLTMSGHVEEAIEYHLMSTAIWTRFSALPERYNMATGGIEGGLGWWVGRPELIESTWYLYRATEDPWYIYVGEMLLRDIKRRCWARCGWTGIQNVLTGEKIDRMESFFLGEAAKYLFLLFDHDHPLNKLDAPFVLSTEGHPLIIPPHLDSTFKSQQRVVVNNRTCPAKAPPLPLTLSNIAARGDIYHAASLARLHLMPERGQLNSVLTEYAADHPSITLADVQSPSNWTFYPWTLPLELVPHNALSSTMPVAPTFELAFPSMDNKGNTNAPLQRVKDGILVNFVGGLRFSMVQDIPMFVNDEFIEGYRVYGINNVPLGKDEKVYIAPNSAYKALNPQDPLFSRIRDPTMLDIVVERGRPPKHNPTSAVNVSGGHEITIESPELDEMDEGAMKAAWNAIVSQLSELVRDAQELVLPVGPVQTVVALPKEPNRLFISAIMPVGIGAAPLPDWPDLVTFSGLQEKEDDQELPWNKVYAAGELCDEKLPPGILRSHQVILIKRGSCSFSRKLSNIPNVHPGRSTFQLVIIVDSENVEEAGGSGDKTRGIGSNSDEFMTRPLLDEPQVTSSGLPRQNLIPMVMVGGGESTYESLKYAKGIGVKRRYSVSTQGVPIANVLIL